MISDPLALSSIFKYALTDTKLAYLALILAAGYLASRGTGRDLSFRIRIGALTAAIYVGMLFIVYITTPKELLWHLQTSADRTTLPAKLTVLAVICLLVAENISQFRKRGRSAPQ